MGKLRLALAAAVLGAAALLYGAVMAADLVTGHWLPGVFAVVAAYASGGGCYLALGRYRKVTSKRRGGGDDDGKADDGSSRPR